MQFLATQSGIPLPHIEKLATADPTPKKKYLPWLVNQVKRNKIRGDMLDTYHPDTLKVHHDALSKFDAAKGQLGDINKYAHIGKIRRALRVADDNKQNKAHEEKFGQRVLNKGGHHVYEVTEPEQATAHGAGTQWCTRIKNGSYQNQYLSQGTLHVHYPPKAIKPGKPGFDTDKHDKFQSFTPHEMDGELGPEFRDRADHTVNFEAHEKAHPVLKDAEHWKTYKKAVFNHTGPEDNEYNDEHDAEYEEEQRREEVQRLAHSRNVDDRVEAVENHAAHHEYAHLWDDHHPSVRQAIIDHGEASGDYNQRDRAHGHFKDDEDEDIRGHIAANSPHPGIIKHMIDNHWDDYEVKHGLASNPHTPQAVKHKLADMHEEHPNIWNANIHSALAANPRSDWEEEAKPTYNSALHHKLLDNNDLNQSGYNAIAQKVANSTRGDKTLIDKMAVHEDPHARQAVAIHFGDDKKYFNQLKNDIWPGVHAMLGKYHPHEYTKADSHYAGKLSAAMYGSHAVRDEILKNHADNSEEKPMLRTEIKAAIVKNGAPHHIEQFKDSTIPDVENEIKRKIPMLHHEGDVGRKTLGILATSKNPNIRAHVATHASASRGTATLAHKLINDPDPIVRREAIYNSSLTPEMRKHAHENDPDQIVRDKAELVRSRLGEL